MIRNNTVRKNYEGGFTTWTTTYSRLKQLLKWITERKTCNGVSFFHVQTSDKPEFYLYMLYKSKQKYLIIDKNSLFSRSKKFTYPIVFLGNFTLSNIDFQMHQLWKIKRCLQSLFEYILRSTRKTSQILKYSPMKVTACRAESLIMKKQTLGPHMWEGTPSFMKVAAKHMKFYLQLGQR